MPAARDTNRIIKAQIPKNGQRARNKYRAEDVFTANSHSCKGNDTPEQGAEGEERHDGDCPNRSRNLDGPYVFDIQWGGQPRAALFAKPEALSGFGSAHGTIHIYLLAGESARFARCSRQVQLKHLAGPNATMATTAAGG